MFFSTQTIILNPECYLLYFAMFICVSLVCEVELEEGKVSIAFAVSWNFVRVVRLTFLFNSRKSKAAARVFSVGWGIQKVNVLGGKG